MSFLAILQALIALLPQAPTLLNAVVQLYNDGKDLLSASDQATVDALLLKAQQGDAAATAAADIALDGASKT